METAGLLLYTGETRAVAKALNVETHTKEEIIQYVKEHTQAGEDKLTYFQEPVVTVPYAQRQT